MSFNNIFIILSALILLASNIVAITITIYRRPTRSEVQGMIEAQFKPESYLGQRLKNIDEKLEHLYEKYSELKNN